jgi:Fur family transcriptional regulator, ferric uptake regulator
MPDNLADQWMTNLQESGYRLTAPRRAIVACLAASERALGPLDLFDQGRKDYPGLGLVTVYRTLEKLEQLGLAQRVHQPDGCHMYLRASRSHEHLLVCTQCGRAEFFSGDDLEPLIQTIAEHSGYQIREHWLQLYGHCAGCRRD